MFCYLLTYLLTCVACICIRAGCSGKILDEPRLCMINLSREKNLSRYFSCQLLNSNWPSFTQYIHEFGVHLGWTLSFVVMFCCFETLTLNFL